MHNNKKKIWKTHHVLCVMPDADNTIPSDHINGNKNIKQQCIYQKFIRSKQLRKISSLYYQKKKTIVIFFIRNTIQLRKAVQCYKPHLQRQKGYQSKTIGFEH